VHGVDGMVLWTKSFFVCFYPPFFFFPFFLFFFAPFSSSPFLKNGVPERELAVGGFWGRSFAGLGGWRRRIKRRSTHTRRDTERERERSDFVDDDYVTDVFPPFFFLLRFLFSRMKVSVSGSRAEFMMI